MTRTRNDRIATLAIFAAGLAWLSLQLRIGISLDDEGLLCDYASRLLRGQTPYVDFIPPYALGRYLSLAALFRAFGENVLVERWMFASMLALAAALTHRVSLRLVLLRAPPRLRGQPPRPYGDGLLVPPAWALFPPLLVLIAPAPLWKADLTLGLAAGALAALRYAEAPGRGRALQAGAVIGLLAWDRPDLPAMAAAMLAVTALFVRARLRDALVCAAVAAAVYAPLVIHLAARPGALAGAIDAHRWMASLHEHDAGVFVAPWRSPYGIFNGALFYAGPALALIGAAVAARRREVGLAVLSVAALLAWNQVRVRVNLSHALQASWPVWVLGTALAVRAGGALRSRVAALALAAPLAAAVWQASLAMPIYAGMIAVARGRGERTGWARGDVWLPPLLRANIDAMLRHLASRGGQVLCAPYAPMLNFLSGLPSPSFLDNLLRGRLSSSAEQRLIDALERTGTRTIVRLDERYDDDPRTFDRYAPVVWAYVERNFAERPRIGVFRVWERVSNPAPATPR